MVYTEILLWMLWVKQSVPTSMQYTGVAQCGIYNMWYVTCQVYLSLVKLMDPFSGIAAYTVGSNVHSSLVILCLSCWRMA